MSVRADVLLIPGWGPGVGGGHALRCLSLAEALEAQGARCLFALPQAGRELLARVSGVERAATDVEAANGALAEFSHVVLDDYDADAAAEIALGADGRKLLVLDDVALRPRRADVTVNPGALGSDPYARFGDHNDLRLLGPSFALLRPAFAAGRAAALKANTSRALRRVFVSFGLSDVGGLSARAYRAIRRFDENLQVDLMLGSSAQSAEIKDAANVDPRLRLHIDTAEVAKILKECDVALGAGGVGVWERACLGRPAAAVSIAPNQEALVDGLGRLGAHIALKPPGRDFEEDVTDALRRLKSQNLRAALKGASSALCDGLGARRVAQTLLDL